MVLLIWLLFYTEVLMAKDSTFHVCLFGCSLNTGNLGVSALTASLIKLITIFKPNVHISLLIGSRNADPQYLILAERQLEISVVNHRFSLRSKLDEHILWIFFLAQDLLLSKLLLYFGFTFTTQNKGNHFIGVTVCNKLYR